MFEPSRRDVVCPLQITEQGEGGRLGGFDPLAPTRLDGRADGLLGGPRSQPGYQDAGIGLGVLP